MQAQHPLVPDERLDELLRAWRSRDNRALRALVERHLIERAGPGATLSTWRRFSQAVFTDQMGPLLARMGDVDVDRSEWAQLAAAALHSVTSGARLRDADDPLVALVTVFVYFEALTFWEYSYEHEPVVELVSELSQWLAGLGGAEDESSAHWLVTDSARCLAESLPYQFRVEDALGATSARALGLSASTVVERLDKARARLQAVAAAPDAATPRALVHLLQEDIDHTLPYFELVARHVGPAACAFTDNLHARHADSQTADLLRAAVEACRDFEASDVGRRGVFSSEARAHRLTLQAGLRLLEERAPSLSMTDGDVVYIYPFGLPTSSTGTDVIRSRLRAHFDGVEAIPATLPRLCGLDTVLLDTPQTDAWAPNLGEDHLIHIGVRLVWETHELVLRTTDGVLYRDLGLEVRLGGLGNYYLRVAVGTRTPTSRDGGQTWSTQDAAWTAHEVDQFLRRVGDEGGANSLWFVPRGAPVGTPTGEVWDSFLDVAAQTIGDLAAYAGAMHRAELEASAGIGGQDAVDSDEATMAEYAEDVGSIRAFLKRHAHVLLAVTQASAVSPGGVVAVEEGAELASTNGFATWMAPQRSFAIGILEWTRYGTLAELASPFEQRIADLDRAMVRCHGDTTLVFAGNCPNWQVLETSELVEFAASLLGVYARRREWLTRKAVSDELEVRSLLQSSREDVVELPSYRAALQTARQIDVRLQERVSRVQTLLDQSRTFMLSRSYHSRAMLDYLCSVNGVAGLGEALEGSVRATSSLQELVRSRIDRLASLTAQLSDAEAESRRARRDRPVALLLSALTVLSLIDLFSWSNGYLGVGSSAWVWGVELVVIIALMGAVLAWSWDRTSQSDAPRDGEDPQSSGTPS